MNVGDFVLVTIDTYDGTELMYGRIADISWTMGIYAEPVFTVGTGNGQSLFDAHELTYLRGPFKYAEIIELPTGPADIISSSSGYVDVCDLAWFSRASYSELGLIEAIYGTPRNTTPIAQEHHRCTEFIVWPFGTYREHCKQCGKWK